MAKCIKCGKPQKENTEGNNRYCQGHSILEHEHNFNREIESENGEIIKLCDYCLATKDSDGGIIE